MWDSILKTVAPLLGTAIGGPFGGMATKFLIDAFGEEVTTEDQMQEAIATASTETLLMLIEVEANSKIKMKELDLKEEDLHAKDRAAARAM